MTVTAYLHDMYYRFVDHATSDHGPKGAEYLESHPEALAKFGLTPEEQKLVRSLIYYHGLHLDIGDCYLPSDIANWPQSTIYQKMALILSFIDLAKPDRNGKYSNRVTPRVAHYLSTILNQIPDILAHPDQFYRLRLRYFLTPICFFELPQKDYQTILKQLDNQPDAADLKQFLNDMLYVDTATFFEKMYRIPGVFPNFENGEKDFTAFFVLLRRLRQIATENQFKKAWLQLKDEKSTYEADLDQDKDPFIRFIQKITQPGDNWRECFEVNPSFKQIWIKL